MAKFLIKYRSSAYDDYGYDKNVNTSSSSIVVEAESLEKAEAISKCIDSTEIYSNEWFYVESVGL